MQHEIAPIPLSGKRGAAHPRCTRNATGTGPLGLHNSGNDFYLVLDNLGSVLAVVNTAGNVVAHYTCDPYGKTVTADESGLSAPNIIRYTGGALDQTTGLTKLGQRYYSPAIGAFTQQDAVARLANPEDGNLYAYAADNPASLIDPTGLQGQDTCSEVPTLYECSVPSTIYSGSGGTRQRWRHFFNRRNDNQRPDFRW